MAFHECPYCGTPTVPTIALIADGKGFQKQMEGTICPECPQIRIFLNDAGGEEPMDFTKRELEIKAQADLEIAGLKGELQAGVEREAALIIDITNAEEQLEKARKDAEDADGRAARNFKKFEDVNAEFQRLKASHAKIVNYIPDGGNRPANPKSDVALSQAKGDDYPGPYCPFCGSAEVCFLNDNEPDTPNRKYQCDDCGKTFLRSKRCAERTLRASSG